MAAVVLAAGESKRMRSRLVKVLHPLAGKRVIAHVLAPLRALGVERLLVVVGTAELVQCAPSGVCSSSRGALEGSRAPQCRPLLSDFEGELLDGGELRDSVKSRAFAVLATGKRAPPDI